MLRSILTAIAGATLVLGLGSCSTPAETTTSSTVVSSEAIIIDVRTPAEFDEGHLEGAQLLDWNSGELTASLGELDPDAEYLVYCRSGNRAAQAVEAMKAAGITNVTNLGSVDEAAAETGLPVVTG